MRFPNIRDKDGHKFLDGTERKDNQINIGNTERKKTVIKQGILDMQEPIYIYILSPMYTVCTLNRCC